MSSPNTWPLVNGSAAGNARSEPPQFNSAVSHESQKTDVSGTHRHHDNHVQGQRHVGEQIRRELLGVGTEGRHERAGGHARRLIQPRKGTNSL